MFACLYSVFKVPPADFSAVIISFWKQSSGDGEIRTHDPLLARQVLSQLSYTPMVGDTTFGLLWYVPYDTYHIDGLKWTRTTDLTLIRRAL